MPETGAGQATTDAETGGPAAAGTGQAGDGQAAAARPSPNSAPSPDPAGQAAGQAGQGAARGRLAGAARRGYLLIPLLRRHWLLSLLLAAGFALRLLSQLAYRPALLYVDSVKYLYNAWPGTDPVGYKIPLKVILLFGNIQTVAAVQHLVGLAMAVGIYVILRRHGVAGWLSALATAPVLLDGYQLQIEQTVMPDVWFEAFILGGLMLLLWRRRPALPAIVAAGLVLGASAPIRQVGEALIVPALIYVLPLAGGWRRALVHGGALCLAFALPIVLYCSIALVNTGHFRLSRSGTSSIYGRTAVAADCATLKLPAAERPLCPTPHQQYLGADFLDHDPRSPLTLFVPPPGHGRSGFVNSFNRAVATQQPLNVLSSWLTDSVKLFALSRVTDPGDTPIWRWQFQGSYPTYNQAVSVNPDGVIVVGLRFQSSGGPFKYEALNPALGGRAEVNKPLALFLRHYQLNGGYTPGPAYLFMALAGLIGSLGLALRRRAPQQRQLAIACLLFFTTA
ncbi:MAG TPA: hypothetical protein VH637_12575, partial [Streptosporangiaceae bacterium]